MFFNLKIITRLGKLLYPSLVWNLPGEEKVLYLTFDDGPIPEVTPWVLSLLKKYNAKATFFCIGENIAKHPALFKQLLTEGHSVGNHTFNHLNGWNTCLDEYVENILKAEENISQHWPHNVKNNAEDREKEENKIDERTETGFLKLFRPPYGRIKPSQIMKLQQLDYKIVMWDIISWDFDQGLSPLQCLNLVKKYSKPGSIVVFHDSLKAEKNLREVLPKVLEFFQRKGYSLESIKDLKRRI